MPTTLFERSRKGEHALLIQPHAGGPPDEGLVEEFADLARSAGATVAAMLPARIDRPNPATLIGSGKLEEVKRSEEHTSELQSLMRISYAVFCLKKKKNNTSRHT